MVTRKKKELRMVQLVAGTVERSEKYFGSIERRWGDWKYWARRGCHYWRNSRGTGKKTERQVASWLRYTKEKLLEETAKVDKVLRVNLKYTALKSLTNYFIQELLLLKIIWEYRLIWQQRERNQCGGGSYKTRLNRWGKT